MIHDLKPYPAMKDSGVPWLGQVPEHWEVKKLKYAVSFSGGGTPSKADASFWNGRIPWVSPKDMRSARIFDATDHITEAAVTASATSIISPDAVLMVVRSGILRRTIPVAINAVEVALNQDMKALRPKAGLLSTFLRALVQGNEAKLIAEWTKQGATVESVEHELLANSRIPLPPLPEQSAIVRFLDYMDRRIRRAIRAKQKLIALLNEQKQAIIHQAVTRGLNPNVRLKPSGVDWLGDVPEHWEIVTLGRIGEFSKGNGGTKDDEVEKGIPCIRYGDIYTQYKFSIRTCRSFVSIERAADYTAIRYGDVLFAGSGETIEEIGKSAVNLLDSEACCGGDILLWRPTRKVVPPFLGYASDSPQSVYQKACMGRGVTIMHIYANRLKNLWLALPPLPEQSAIIQFLDESTARITTALHRANKEIDFLREYRTRLIAEVVTGKLDVREAAARLPEEAEEPEPLDEADALEGSGEEAAEADLNAAPREATA